MILTSKELNNQNIQELGEKETNEQKRQGIQGVGWLQQAIGALEESVITAQEMEHTNGKILAPEQGGHHSMESKLSGQANGAAA